MYFLVSGSLDRSVAKKTMIHDVLSTGRERSSRDNDSRVLVDVFRAESKRAKQTRLVRSDVNAQPAPSPKFSAVYHRKFLYTVACTPHGVQLGPPCCPRRIPFVFYRVQQARCFVHIYIYIYSRFVMNFQRIPPRFFTTCWLV